MVLELLPERDVVSVVLAGEQEKKEVPFVAVDHASPLPIRLSLLNPAIVNRLLEMQKTLQRSELS